MTPNCSPREESVDPERRCATLDINKDHQATRVTMADLQKLVSEQASVMGVGGVPVVEDPDDNAASTDGKSIYFNSSFMSKIESSAGEGGLRFVLAHELGHIADGMGGGHGAELSADQFGARSVAAMGYDSKAV